jgi:outer membrane protein OmpA-like peptidoglycan-associated protein
MAELNVEPKSQRPWWLWLLLAVIALAILLFLLRGCDGDEAARDPETTSATDPAATSSGVAADNDWNDIDRNAPAATYEEITDQDINVRGNDQYAIYSLDETILFDTDSKEIRSGAEQKLKQVAASMEQRFANGQVRVYGYTDARGSAGYNQQLAEERAEAIQDWLVQNGEIGEDVISVHPVGESQPIASNATAEGRQQNRRVEIVARQGN